MASEKDESIGEGPAGRSHGSCSAEKSVIAVRPLTRADTVAVGLLWRESYAKSHGPLVPAKLMEFRTQKSFTLRLENMLASPPDSTTITNGSLSSSATEGVDGGGVDYAWVAEDASTNTIAGFISIRPKDREVYQVFVSELFHGTGVAQMLLQHAEANMICIWRKQLNEVEEEASGQLFSTGNVVGNPSCGNNIIDNEKYDANMSSPSSCTTYDQTPYANIDTRLLSYRAHLHVAVGNDRARRFYEKMGWSYLHDEILQAECVNEETGEPMGSFPLAVWRMEKLLGESATK